MSDEIPTGEAPDAPTPRPGRYKIGKLIGEGGMAIVQEAEDTHLGRRVAIKTMRTNQTARTLSWLEAAFGQIYLVVLVAHLVSRQLTHSSRR